MLIHNKNFNIKQIADSGQCFRLNRLEGTIDPIRYGLVAYGKYLVITQLEDETVELTCTEEEFHQLWEDYFDLKYDYGRIVQELTEGEDRFLAEAAAYGKGIRILKQEPFEAAISFIISQNKNIPAIKNCIEGICSRYGERRISREANGREYSLFPAPEALAAAVKEDLRALKTGYRDDYIITFAQAVANGNINLEYLRSLGYEEAVKSLIDIRGIGEKVANCISLYGLHHIDGFPVDVWIRRVLKEIYNDKFDKEKYSGYAGILQQYMFYYMREQKSTSK